MYSSYRYFIYEFLFMCLFMYFMVYCGHSKFVYESFRFHNKNFDEMRGKLDFTENRVGSKKTQPHLTPSTPSNLFLKLICFFYVETHKVSTSIRGGFHVLLHKKFHEQVHSAHVHRAQPTYGP